MSRGKLKFVDTFEFQGQTFEYFDHEYNTTRLNERTVEIPVFLDWIRKQPGGSVGLELGNVLEHYVRRGWRVVDKYEKAPGVENIDAKKIKGEFDWIVSISTLEHCGFDGSEKLDIGYPYDALNHLRSLLVPGGKLLLSIPLGYNPHADWAIQNSKPGPNWQVSVVRNGPMIWEESPEPVDIRPYGATTIWAESVWFGEFGPLS